MTCTPVEVVIVGVDPFGLVVRDAASIVDVRSLPNYGEPLQLPTEMVQLRHQNVERVQHEHEDRLEWADSWVWKLGGCGSVLGGGIGWLVAAETGALAGVLIGFAVLVVLPILLVSLCSATA